MNLEKLKQRNSTLDIVRIIAVFAVVSVHFFQYTNFYGETLQGPAMYYMSVTRVFCNICVPLFIILTGYLMSQKCLSKKYYSGITKTLVVYVLCSIACIIFRIIELKEKFTLQSAVTAILDFTGANYSWYIEMYIGLFLIIPFLNLIYNNLKDQKQKQILVFTFAAISILPSLFNIYNFDSYQWWVNPSLSTDYQVIYIDWWRGIYPLTYYFMGCYFREYGMKIKTKTLVITLIVSTFLFGAFNYYRNYGSSYYSGQHGYWNGFEACVTSALTFVLITRLKTDKLGIGLKWSLWKLADYSLGIYLLSYIFDTLVYRKFNQQLTDIEEKFPYFLVVVPFIFIVTAIASGIITSIADGVIKGFTKLTAFIKKQRMKNNGLFWQNVLFVTLLFSALLFAFNKCVYGFGGNDEAFYLTVPHRLSLGDAFIKHEWHLSQLSGFLLYPFVSLYRLLNGTNVGIMLTARIMYVILHAVVSVVIYQRLKKYGILSVIACVLYFVFTPYDIMVYSYNTMGLDFVVLTGVILGTAGYKKPLPIILSGITLACSVLCCPYLAVAYLLFGVGVAVHYIIRKFNWKCVFSTEMFSLKTFLWFTSGVFIVAIPFLIFALSRVSISEIFEYLPHLMTDPEHPTIPFMTRMESYFRSIVNFQETFHVALKYYGVLLLVMILDRKRKLHRSLYLIGTIGIVIFTYVLVYSELTTKYYNAVMFPMIFVGLTSYILCEKKPRTLLASLFSLGIIYSLAITFSSNQYFYVIATASAASNIASNIFLSRLLQEMKEKEDNLDYALLLKRAAFVMTAFMLIVQSGLQITAKKEHVFWENGTKTLTEQITRGPAKGIYTTPYKRAVYENIYNDLQYYKTKEKGTILCLSEKTWIYLALNDYEYGTLSAWISGERQSSLDRLDAYFDVNPEKLPKYIYIPKQSNWDFTNIHTKAQGAGYSITENDISYKLEKVN